MENKTKEIIPIPRTLSRRSSSRYIQTTDYKSTLGEKFIEWFETKIGNIRKIKQDHIPVVFIKLKVNAIYEINIAKGTFIACFTVMQDW
jgi:hypothetical protein